MPLCQEFAVLDYLIAAVWPRAASKTGVSDLAVVLDDGYVPLGGAAKSLARLVPDCTPDEFMELFKTALFNGEFDDRPEEYGGGLAQDVFGNEQAAVRLHPMQRCQIAARGERASTGPGGTGKSL